MSYLNKPLKKKELVKKVEEIHNISKLNCDEFVKEFPDCKEHLENNPQDLYLFQSAVINAKLDILLKEAKGG